MQKVATYDTVAKACEKLKAEGKKITGRAVVGLAGGSQSTVLPLIKEWRQGNDKALAVMPSEIPAELERAILHALGLAQAEAAEKLQNEIEQAAEREEEALEALAEASRENESLSSELAEIKKQTVTERQMAETTAAVMSEKITTMGSRIEALETERQQLIESAEVSRTESAKAMLQVERADVATAKAEARVQLLEDQLQLVKDGQTAAEKKSAVAEARLEGEQATTSDLKERLADLQADMKATTTDLKERLAASQAELQATVSLLTKCQADIADFREQVQKDQNLRATVERERDDLVAQVKLLNKEILDLKNAFETH